MDYHKKIIIISICVLLLAQDTLQFWGRGMENKKKKDSDDDGKKEGKKKNCNAFTCWYKRRQSDKKQGGGGAGGGGGGGEEEGGAAPQQPPPVGNRKAAKIAKEKGQAPPTPAPPQETETEPPEPVEGPACSEKSEEMMEKIKELRTALEGNEKITATSDIASYIQDDNYAMRWLVAVDSNVANAQNLILNHVAWREKNQIDDIEKEDFGDIDKTYNVDDVGHDKDGRPIVEWWLADWDVAAALTDPNIGTKKLLRWMLRLLEFATKDIHELNTQKKFCVTQAVLLVDLKDVDANKHACAQCLQLYAVWAQLFEIQYPSLFLNVHFANFGNPVSVNILKVMVASFKQRQKTAAVFKMYKTDEELNTALGEIIDSNQRSAKFGGTMKAE